MDEDFEGFTISAEDALSIQIAAQDVPSSYATALEAGGAGCNDSASYPWLHS